MELDIELVLEELGLETDVRGNEALGLCPMHLERTGKQDNSPSWWVNLSTGQHICFSCHYKGNIYQLICDVKEFYLTSWGDVREYDYDSAKVWLSTITEVSPDKLAEELSRIPTRISSAPKPLEMSDARLAVFVDPPLEQLQSRNISLESTRAYGILWDAKNSSWVFPFREPRTHRLLGWQEKGTLTRSFMNRPPGLPKSRTLFGLNMLDEDTVYVVESPLDCARLYTAGFMGAVAICGSSVSEDQIKLLRSASRVIAAFDNPKVDPAGQKASKEMLDLALTYGLNLSFFNYGDSGKKDPGDLTDEEIAWGIDNSKFFLYGDAAYV
jgi:hypothetical protein